MSATKERSAVPTGSEADPQPADVFVVFGITGDLAKVMTFRSLYRLEQRGLLDYRVVGRRGRRLDGRRPGEARPRVASHFSRQDAVEETWRIVQPLLDSPSQVEVNEPGSWGPAAADGLLRDYPAWHDPWLPS